jgi:K+ transporter
MTLKENEAVTRGIFDTDEIVWITVGILVALFAIQRFGTDKVGYLFAPIILLWLLLIAAVGFYNLVKYDTGALRAFNMKYIIDYFRRNKKKGWASLGGILLCFTGNIILGRYDRHLIYYVLCYRISSGNISTTNIYMSQAQKPFLLI